MTELINNLSAHASKYPLMEPCDAVKLIFQNEFGGGHLITDEKKCLQRLYDEFAVVSHDLAFPLTEDIGNGLVRVNLQAVDNDNVTLEHLADVFIVSSKLHKGNRLSLLEKLYESQINFDSIGFNFSLRDYQAYVEQYTSNDFPLISHSKVYKEAYSPAYRVLIGSNLDV